MPLTFEQIESALDAGKLEMMRPWGDWVGVRRATFRIKMGAIPILHRNVEGFAMGDGGTTFIEAWG